MASPFSFLYFLFLFGSHLALNLAQLESYKSEVCKTFSCGTVLSIQFPFCNKDHPECGIYPINCTKNNIPMIKFEDKGRSYVVKSISYESRLLVIQDNDLLANPEPEICDFLHNFTLPVSPLINFNITSPKYTFFNCKHGRSTLYPISSKLNSYKKCKHYELYYTKEWLPPLKHDCSVLEIFVSEWFVGPYDSRPDLIALLSAGFGLEWNLTPECEKCRKKRGLCHHNETTGHCTSWGDTDKTQKITLIGFLVGGVVFLLTCASLISFCLFKNSSRLSIFFWKKRMLDTHKIETFLENYGSLCPKRYRFSELKKITNSFQDKLGQGGYGGVYKGKFPDGPYVAVKLLNNSKGNNGEDFMNEVASIGRTYHVNVVTLLGFCSEGSKRALIYEFMPNGSLEKFIFSKESGEETVLDFEKLFQIAIGIARGLEYLHRGCNTRIIHLDIKPHNILLDENFCPKISDFGLAKLCPKQESMISMLDSRGTVGYVAPELFCRNIGGVSHKSDVYSYGMMVLEMVGRRKNIDAHAQNASEIYFPQRVYKHIGLGESLGLLGMKTQVEEQIAKKMILVGLWCIQTDPANRPSMSKVVKMLQGSLECLEMPPKPYLSSP